MENAEILTYINIFWRKNKIIVSDLYLCLAKQLFITSSLVLKAHIVLNISDGVLQTYSFTVNMHVHQIFLLFLPQI